MHNQVARVHRNFTQSLETCEQVKPIFVKKTLGASCPTPPPYDSLALCPVLSLGIILLNLIWVGYWVLLLRLGSK